jgi:hypothetical protein
MIDIFARSVFAGKNLGMPSARDSAIASQVSWAMLSDAVGHHPPVIGTKNDMREILQHRRSLRSGYGLPSRPQDSPDAPVPAGQPPMACGEEICGLQEAANRAANQQVVQ